MPGAEPATPGNSSTGALKNLDKVAPSGMVAAALIFIFGNVSGAHYNPAVTFAFDLWRVFPWLGVLLAWHIQGAPAAEEAEAAVGKDRKEQADAMR